MPPSFAGCIRPHKGVIPAIREHIAGDCVGGVGGGVAVCIEEAAVGGVVIARLQIVEPGFVVVVITTVAQGLTLAILPDCKRRFPLSDFNRKLGITLPPPLRAYVSLTQCASTIL